MKNCSTIIESSLQNLKLSLTELNWDQFVVGTIEALMNIERGDFLMTAYADKGNGHYQRIFKSLLRNRLMINIPRTRTGVFSPMMLELIKINSEQVNTLCISLYRKGMTTKDISELMEETFGESVSKTKICNLAQQFNEFRIAWENSKLERYYKAIFCDCIFVEVRRVDRYEKEAVYVSYGVREDNRREIISIDINPTESSEYWGTIFEKIKSRGVKEVGLFVADGLKGLREKVLEVFPQSDFQKCCIHKIRNVLMRTRSADKAEMANDLKILFDNFGEQSTVENGLKKLTIFLEKWKRKYPSIVNLFAEEDLEFYFTYIKYPARVRRMIYTTNSIENINRQIRKATKNKLSFESPDRLLDYIFIVLKDFEANILMKYSIYEFGQM